MRVALSAEVLAAHAVSIPPHVCVNGSMTWQRATCLTWWDLQDHPPARTNTSAASAWRRKGRSFHTLPQARGQRFSTCFQTPVRKRLCAFDRTLRMALRRGRATGCNQTGWLHISQVQKEKDVFPCLGKRKTQHCECIWKLWGIRLKYFSSPLTPVGSYGKSVD